jgi:hypothetical protein
VVIRLQIYSVIAPRFKKKKNYSETVGDFEFYITLLCIPFQNVLKLF